MSSEIEKAADQTQLIRELLSGPRLHEPQGENLGIKARLPRYHESRGTNPTYEIVQSFDVRGHEVAWMEYVGYVERDITGQGREGQEYRSRQLCC